MFVEGFCEFVEGVLVLACVAFVLIKLLRRRR